MSYTAEENKLRWLMDGKVFVKGTSAQWMPWPGRHLVQLANSRGTLLDEIQLELRGRGLRWAAQWLARHHEDHPVIAVTKQGTGWDLQDILAFPHNEASTR